MYASCITDYRNRIFSQRHDAQYRNVYGAATAQSSLDRQRFLLRCQRQLFIDVCQGKGLRRRTRHTTSGVVVSVDSGVPTAKFDVLVNRSLWGTIRGDQQVPILLNPFQRYELEIRSAGEEMIDVAKPERSVVLYPGNVVQLTWTTRQVVVLIGTVKDESGAPIPNAASEAHRKPLKQTAKATFS